MFHYICHIQSQLHLNGLSSHDILGQHWNLTCMTSQSSFPYMMMLNKGSHVPHTVEHPKADVASSLVHSTVIIPGTIVFGFLTFIFNMFIRVHIISYFFKIFITFQYFQIIVYVYFFTFLRPSESFSLPNNSRFSAPHSKAFTFSQSSNIWSRQLDKSSSLLCMLTTCW
jgi:hypothetical protein